MVNPLRSDNDQRQISLCNINAFSVIEVTRIKDMITQIYNLETWLLSSLRFVYSEQL